MASSDATQRAVLAGLSCGIGLAAPVVMYAATLPFSSVNETVVAGAVPFAVGAVADIVGGVLAGYAINPLITLGAASIGLVGGWLWQTLPHTLRLGQRLLLSVVAAHVVGSIIINSLALHIFYGYAWSVLAARVPNALILTAVNTVLLRLLMENKAVMAAVKK